MTPAVSMHVFLSSLARPGCATLLLGMLVSPASHACYAPPREQLVSPDAQIALATDVSLAKVVRATPLRASAFGRPPVEYEFEVHERILGPDEQRFILIGAKGPTRISPSSGDHGGKAFWESGGGRLHNDSDCILKPDFTVGEYYLVFRGKPATWRSFEHIATVRGRPDPDDPWLSYVKEKLEARRQRMTEHVRR
jgi:hypothetical protein